ncbi:MAG: Rpn family recombination-promoting nuclease/putative transposase [Cyanobacteria bacterium P01_C01_bin.73]
MAFINPKTDFAFKKIFGSPQSQPVLISFLNGLLYDGIDIIESLTILNPYQAPRVRGMKDTYLDVKAQLNDGTSVIIEMQVLNVEGFEKRILYNAAKTYSTQLSTGDNYRLLNPVIALTITDFVMFEELDSYRSCFVLKEKDFLIDYPSYDLELVFVELPKFERSLTQLDSLMERWLFFLKNAKELRTIPAEMETVPALRQAFEFANQANLTPEELENLEHREMFIHDQRNAIKRALNQGRKEGREEGERSLILRQLARQVGPLPDSVRSQLNQLSVESLAALGEALLDFENLDDVQGWLQARRQQED